MSPLKAFNFRDWIDKHREYLKPPISHLQHCEYNDYTMQLSVYGVMYERETGKRFNRGGLFYWDKINENFSFIPIPYMKREAEDLINSFSFRRIQEKAKKNEPLGLNG